MKRKGAPPLAGAGERAAVQSRRRMPPARAALLVGAGLVVATLALFAPACANDFVNFDDPPYVTANSHVQAGPTGDGVVWAFTVIREGNWHPLTWLSLEWDARCYGLKPWGFHLTNVLLHAANVGLLFEALRRLTGALGRSALTAALFAVHPLHVESVAWVAERKDVLSGLFWMLTLLAYSWYAGRPGVGRFALVLTTFALGLMAKSMLVTLPCVLLLLDYWPLRRPPSWRLLWEKAPLLALSAAVSAVTWYGQQHEGALRSLSEIPLSLRCANAPVAYCAYIFKAIWPVNLGVYYPYPSDIPAGEVVAAAVVLGAVSALAVWQRQRAPYLIVGWLWFLGTLVPVIGLVQVGAQAMADRYTYIPLIGLAVMAVWGGADLMAFVADPVRPLALLIPGLLLALLALLSVAQELYWHDSVTLWEHAHDLAAASPVIENNLGDALEQRGSLEEALPHYAAAERLDPDYMQPHIGMARILSAEGKDDAAAKQYEQVIRLAPDDPGAHANLGQLLLREGRADAAAEHFRQALAADPTYGRLWLALATALDRQGDAEGAAYCRKQAAALPPDAPGPKRP